MYRGAQNKIKSSVTNRPRKGVLYGVAQQYQEQCTVLFEGKYITPLQIYDNQESRLAFKPPRFDPRERKHFRGVFKYSIAKRVDHRMGR